jgi:predicted O-methyltransferase YrrM
VPHPILNDAVAEYLDDLVPMPDPLLAEMQAHGDREGIPIIVPDTAMLLSLLARACAARRVVEVGTAIGVSTLVLARAVGPGGLVVSFEVDKSDYPRHLALILPLLRPGGMVAIDNVLLDGQVATGEADSHWSPDSIATMRRLNASLVARADLTAWVLPVGDGVAVAVRD